eukprot:scaffold46164_cov54-Attheya_sp.AAC.5
MDRCSIRICPSEAADTPKFKCSVPNCAKEVHLSCVQMMMKKYKLDEIQIDGEFKYFCDINCRKGILRHDYSKLQWQKDGANGPTDPNNSETILLEWLTTQGNYKSYRTNDLGFTKLQYAKLILEKCMMAGVVATKRTPKNVVDKVSNVELKFNKARKWISNEGKGMKESNPKAFWMSVNKICPFYAELEPIMGDIASCSPIPNPVKKRKNKTSHASKGSNKKQSDPQSKTSSDVQQDNNDPPEHALENQQDNDDPSKRTLENQPNSGSEKLWVELEQEDAFKMNSIRRMNELREMGWSDEHIGDFLPRVKPYLRFGKPPT